MATTAPSPQWSKLTSWLGVRHFQFVMLFLTLIIFYGIRTSLSVAIISMTDKNSLDSTVPTYPEWDNTDMILSSFFWGYIIPQVGAGQLSEYFGPKWFLFTTMVIGSVLHIIIPPMAGVFGSTGVIVCRVLQGLNQGFLYPSIHNLISRWSPSFERSRVANFVYGGTPLGIAISMVSTGALCESTNGWPLAFYVYGGLGVSWAILFVIFVENSPRSHKTISKEERLYIETSNNVTQTAVKKLRTPWKSIATSLPLWAIFISACAQCWCAFTLLTEIPSYMSNIMEFDMKDNSQLSALPYLALAIVGFITGPISDKLISRKILNITPSRKIFNSLGIFVPSAALIYLAFVDKSQNELATALLVIAVGTSGCAQSGSLVNVIDIAPNYAGTLLGIINGTSNIFSILGPLTVGFLGSDKSDPILWRKVFLLAAGINVGCGLFYDIFTSAEVQPWNDIEAKSDVEAARKEKIQQHY